ncbi:hypothetical protein ARMSODRAFT_952289 [Armillaria solidipes]|uniref:Uncharacterized protein n=1 Tax=Armillaria solidipes TaxID=1076256 RepID=A0A2H3BR06_9AGAR|nr:hypothetical protein ARMSODRAFT_952289 [Armillaria solidipes]
MGEPQPDYHFFLLPGYDKCLVYAWPRSLHATDSKRTLQDIANAEQLIFKTPHSLLTANQFALVSLELFAVFDAC